MMTNETFLVVLLAVLAVSFIYFIWKRMNPPASSETQKRPEVQPPIHTRPVTESPRVVINYDIDLREEAAWAREKTMTLRNSGGPAFKVQIQAIQYKNFDARFPLKSELSKGDSQSVQVEVYQDGKIAGLLRHDFVRVLEAIVQDSDRKEPIFLEARVLYEDGEGTSFCSLHEIEYGPVAKKVTTVLKWNGKESEMLSEAGSGPR